MKGRAKGKRFDGASVSRPGVRCECGWSCPIWVAEKWGFTHCLGCGQTRIEDMEKVTVGRVVSIEAEVRAEHYAVAPATVEEMWKAAPKQAAPKPDTFGQDETTKALSGIAVTTGKEG